MDLKKINIINTQTMLINKYNIIIDRYHFGDHLKIYDINNTSKEELLSKFITYINQIMKTSDRKGYDIEFEQPFEPSKIIHRLGYIMFPVCIFKFGDKYEATTLLDVCQNWTNVSSAEWILIPVKKDTVYYDYIYSINNKKHYNIYYARSKKDKKKPQYHNHATFNKHPTMNYNTKKEQPKFTQIEKKIFKPAKINSREITSEENLIRYQYELIKELYSFL